MGKYDPAWITQALKRVAGAKDGWSAVAADELLRLGGLNEQFALVCDSLRRLFPQGEELADALSQAAQTTVTQAKAPNRKAIDQLRPAIQCAATASSNSAQTPP